MGLPEILPIVKVFNVQYRFHDAQLTSMVEAARQGISIDERRRLYPSYPWANMQELTQKYDRRLRPTHLQQWFPGNHGSVGGGGSITGLSSIALNWIALGVREAGLEIDFAALDTHADDYDVTAPLVNKPSMAKAGLAGGVLRFLRGDRSGPDTLEDVSMSAIDRCFEVRDYVDTPTLHKVGDLVQSMDEEQRANMRKARQWVDGALTHKSVQKTRPKNLD